MNLGNSGGYGATTQFFRVNEPAWEELTQLVHEIAHRLGRYLERQGWLDRDAEDSYLALKIGVRSQ